jgi:hypothetical protein
LRGLLGQPIQWNVHDASHRALAGAAAAHEQPAHVDSFRRSARTNASYSCKRPASASHGRLSAVADLLLHPVAQILAVIKESACTDYDIGPNANSPHTLVSPRPCEPSCSSAPEPVGQFEHLVLHRPQLLFQARSFLCLVTIRLQRPRWTSICAFFDVTNMQRSCPSGVGVGSRVRHGLEALGVEQPTTFLPGYVADPLAA